MQWKIIKNDGGATTGYRIASKSSLQSRVAVVEHGSTDNAANINQFQYNATTNEQWYFRLISAPSNPYAALGWEYFFRGAHAKYVGGWYYYQHGYNGDIAHSGVDVLIPATSSGAPAITVNIYASCSGTVVGRVNQADNKYVYIKPDSSPPGTTLQIEYYHMGSINVSLGQRVTPSTILGTVGNTGQSDTAHLHFAVSKIGKYSTNSNDYINPQLFFPNKKFTHNGITP